MNMHTSIVTQENFSYVRRERFTWFLYNFATVNSGVSSRTSPDYLSVSRHGGPGSRVSDVVAVRVV